MLTASLQSVTSTVLVKLVDGRTCSNDDECTTGVHACSSHAPFSDAPKSYECECQVGFSGSGFECDNIDKCSKDTNECDENATCTDTVGSYYCACNTSYNQESDDVPLGYAFVNDNECKDGSSFSDQYVEVGTCQDNDSFYTKKSITSYCVGEFWGWTSLCIFHLYFFYHK